MDLDSPILTSLPGKHLLGISLKMYFTPNQTTAYATSLLPLLSALPPTISLFLIPDFTTISSTRALLPSTVTIGAQNCSDIDHGALTGETSPISLQAIGCKIIELGHAERRSQFHETNQNIALKAHAVVRNNMIPLICIGEVHRSPTISSVVGEIAPQILSALQATSEFPETEVIFAYEPVWAIGREEPAMGTYVCDVVQGLRTLCGGRKVRFLYGGSAGPGTWEGVKGAVDGLFLGRFAHRVENVGIIVGEMEGA